MDTLNESEQRIMEVILRSPECELEELVLECEGLTWNQVFLEIDRLSRCGNVRLTQKRPGVYTVVPCSQSAPRQLTRTENH
jgi:hypothetical protein